MNRVYLVVSCLALGALGAHYLHSRSSLQGQPPPAVAVPKEMTSYRDIVRKVLPAVVSVEALAKNGGRARRPGDMALPEELRRFTDGPRFDQPDDDQSRVGFGSGFLISARGVIVTNAHVLEGADQVRIQTSTGKRYTSRNIRTDPKSDLAIIQLEAKEAFPYLEFGDSDAMEIGDRVLAVGAPFGLAGTVTHGILSSKGRSLRMNFYEDFLQTDAAINPGNSGGPLVNLEGRVIGVTSAIKSRSGGSQGVGLAISSNLGRNIVAQLLKDGVVKRGYLGVGILDVDEEMQQELGLKEASGVKVTRLYPDAPGDKAGLKANDVIVRIGDKRIRGGRELQMVVAGLPLGKPVEVEIVRGGKPQTVKVTIEEQPRTFGSSMRGATVPQPGRGALVVEHLGLTVADLTAELAEALGYPESVRGALITQVIRDGVAHLAGLRPGKVILSVNKKAVTTARAAATAMAATSPREAVVLQVRGPRTKAEEVTLRAEE
jgi:serine protease Do